jgi:hypothetical protein
MFKIFLKLLGVTRTLIQILGSGSVKKFIKTENANDSRSGRGRDPRIVPNRMQMHLDPDSWIRIQEFFMRTPDSHQVRTVRYGPPPPDMIGLEPLLYVRGTRHLDHPWEAGNAMPCSRTMPSRSSKSQTRKYHVYHYHLTVNPPWTYQAWKGIYFSPACRFGVFPQGD